METKNDNRHYERSEAIQVKQTSFSTKFSGFTLVELIVVITILVILGTIAFINIGGFSGSARDSARISDVTNLSKGLDIYRVKNSTVPVPTGNGLGVLVGTGGLGIQGYAGDTVIRAAGLSWEGKDPSDKMYYTYSTDSTYTKYQLMAFLEDRSTKVSLIPGDGAGFGGIVEAAHAAATDIDYSLRIPSSKGDELGILLGNSGSDTNRPLQELYDINSFTGVNIQAYSGSIKAVMNNTDAMSGILTNLQASYTAKAVSYSSSWAKIDKNCNKPDMVVGSQTWAGCNSTLGTLAMDYAYNYSTSNCKDYNTGASLASCPSVPTGKSTSTMTEADYLPGQSDNIFGALYEWSGATSGLYQSNCLAKEIPASDTNCPCKAGYHIPSIAEWDTLEMNLGCSSTERATGLTVATECLISNTADTVNGLGWTSTNPNSLRNRLGLTLAGKGNPDDQRGYRGRYQSSDSSWAITIGPLFAASVQRKNGWPVTSGSSVRCVRD